MCPVCVLSSVSPANCQEVFSGAARYAVSIERGPPCTGPVHELWQRLANQRAARRKLIQLRRAEWIADSYGALWHRSDLSEARLADLRRTRREQYRAVTAVELDERAAVKQLLERVAETGEQTVTETIRLAKRLLIDVIDGDVIDRRTG